MRKFIDIAHSMTKPKLIENELPLNHQFRNYAFNVVEKGAEFAYKELDRVQKKIEKAKKLVKHQESQTYRALDAYVPMEFDLEAEDLDDDFDAHAVSRALCAAQDAIVTAQKTADPFEHIGSVLREDEDVRRYKVGDRVRLKGDGRVGTIESIDAEGRYKLCFELEEGVPQKPLTPAEMHARKAEEQEREQQNPQQKPAGQVTEPAGEETVAAGQGNVPAGEDEMETNNQRQAGEKPNPAGVENEDEIDIDADKALAFLKSKGILS